MKLDFRPLDSEFLMDVTDRIVTEKRAVEVIEHLVDCGEAKLIAETLCRMQAEVVFEALTAHLVEEAFEERESLVDAVGSEPTPSSEVTAPGAEVDKRRVRPLDAAATGRALVQGGDFDVVLRVSADDVREAWECFSEFLEPRIAAEDGWSEDEVRIACAAFWVLTRSMPASSYDWTMWLIRTQCRMNIEAVMEKELDLVSMNDERRRVLLGRVRQLDVMLRNRAERLPETQ